MTATRCPVVFTRKSRIESVLGCRRLYCCDTSTDTSAIRAPIRPAVTRFFFTTACTTRTQAYTADTSKDASGNTAGVRNAQYVGQYTRHTLSNTQRAIHEPRYACRYMIRYTIRDTPLRYTLNTHAIHKRIRGPTCAITYRINTRVIRERNTRLSTPSVSSQIRFQYVTRNTRNSISCI